MDQDPKRDSRKEKLFLSLRRRMKMAGYAEGSSDDEESTLVTNERRAKLLGNKNAVKATMTVNMGWIHDNKIIRLQTGGGTRTIKVCKTATRSELLVEGKQLFFKNGESQKGNVDEFTFDILDFERKPLPPKLTLTEIQSLSSVARLRFYLSTQPASRLSSEGQSTVNVSVDEVCNSSADTLPLEISDEDDILPSLSTSDSESIALSATGSTKWTPEVDEKLLDLDHSYCSQDVVLPTLSSANDRRVQRFDSFETTVRIARANILQDLVTAFKAPEIIQSRIKFQYINEIGSDEDGVSRDVYSCFWADLFLHSCEGETYRVPAGNNKWEREEWGAVGKILLKGFKELKYFPLKLAPVFAISFILSESDVTPEILLGSFFKYVGPADAQILTDAISGTGEVADDDTLIEILGGLGCHSIPKREELKECLLRVAHCKLIQDPRYFVDRFAGVAAEEFRRHLPDTEAILKLYDQIKPTSLKVTKLIKGDATSANQQRALGFLLQYIRAQSGQQLEILLRFLTGADVICVEQITIEFTTITGAGRRPIAHCCGPVLELPSTYANYRDLRCEFDSILQNERCMLMDIV